MKRSSVLATLVLMVTSSPAFAHLNPAEHGSFAAGFTHPLTGADHILAMVVVGLWAAMLGGRALYAVPLSFVGVMVLGFVAALSGLPLPYVEPVILASVIVIGLLVALAFHASTRNAALIVGFSHSSMVMPMAVRSAARASSPMQPASRLPPRCCMPQGLRPVLRWAVWRKENPGSLPSALPVRWQR